MTRTEPTIALVCAECGKVWRVRPNIPIDPPCPKCGSMDSDVREEPSR